MGLHGSPHDAPPAPWEGENDAAGMDDRTLLRHVIRTLDPRHADADVLADILLARFGSAGMVLSASPQDLDAVTGMYPMLSPLIAALREAALRLHRAYVRHGDALSGHRRIVDYLQAVMGHDSTEQFRVLFLDAAYRLVDDRVLGVGTVDQAPVYPREIMRHAMDLDARILILAHNHPSGDPMPSAADIQMTMHIEQIARVMGIRLHDHMVVGNGRSLSFRRAGLI
ncbi:JAB domain-containing protein [Novacetimonas pomaceti]|uniref:JAB domain-containing protein n=1 Tax=Novacetimonas pomaceti TaxID=2021998 RepID=UPI001C2D04CB|nr:DNA repair protein RadC [Novacetimonas pomaceti]MBV1834201.1 DNA repair protein RadC [Novacetimonas pomaceti]